MNKVMVMLFKDIFNKSLCVYLKREQPLYIVYCATYTQLDRFVKHFLKDFDKGRSLDVKVVELDFEARMDISFQLEKHFGRQ